MPRDANEFSEYFAGVMRRESGSATVSVKAPLTLSVDGLDVNIQKVYSFCQAKPDDCEKAAAFYARSVANVAKQQNMPVDKTKVRLVIRPTIYLAQVQERFGADGPKLQSRSLVGGWVIIPVLDTPNAVRPLDERDLKKLGLGEDELFKLGADNLQTSLAPLAERAKPVATGQIGTFAGDIYEVSRIALHGQWSGLAMAQHGTLIVALPTSGRVLYISDSTPQAIDALRTLSEHTAAKAADPFAPTMLLRWTTERWEKVQ
jgi:hypothetical protein